MYVRYEEVFWRRSTIYSIHNILSRHLVPHLSRSTNNYSKRLFRTDCMCPEQKQQTTNKKQKTTNKQTKNKQTNKQTTKIHFEIADTFIKWICIIIIIIIIVTAAPQREPLFGSNCYQKMFHFFAIKMARFTITTEERQTGYIPFTAIISTMRNFFLIFILKTQQQNILTNIWK